MEEFAYNFHVLIGVFLILQVVLAGWSFFRAGSLIAALSTFLIPFLGLPWSLFMLRGGLKDNQVAGAVTYLCVIIGIVVLIRFLPADERPWKVIFTMQFFAGLSVLNVINLSVRLG